VFSRGIRPEKIVFTNDAVDQKGGVLIPSVTTVTFEEQDGKTKMTMHTKAKGMVDIAAQMLQGMETGWSQSFDRLADAIARR
jgi:uncharacterized protein YndB with AHSA1/START domain